MLAIFSNTLENAQILSESLQRYWNARGVYKSISLFDVETEFMAAMRSSSYDCVILDRMKNPTELIPKIQDLHPSCKIAVVTDNKDSEKDNKIALACYNLGIELMLPIADFELPLAKLSKKLNLV